MNDDGSLTINVPLPYVTSLEIEISNAQGGLTTRTVPVSVKDPYYITDVNQTLSLDFGEKYFQDMTPEQFEQITGLVQQYYSNQDTE